MIAEFAPLFYAEKLNQAQWRLLIMIAKMPRGFPWLLAPNYPDATGQTIRDLKEQRLIASRGWIGDLEAGCWHYAYSCTEHGYEAVRLLTDEERIACFPSWGHAAKSVPVTRIPKGGLDDYR